MSAPRLEVDLFRIEHNARVLAERLSGQGISITGVTKAGLGSVDIANALLRGGACGLGDSRVQNIEHMRGEGVAAPMTLIRSPMLGEVERIVHVADTSCNTELAVMTRLSEAAARAGRLHEVVLMVELGDLREGIMPDDLANMVRAVLRLPGIVIAGIGANLACHAGVTPDADNMGMLSLLADSIERTFGIRLAQVSGGNSANLAWALSGADVGRINNLRLGEAILLGCEPLHREPIRGLYQDAFTLVGEVIESKVKPARPWGALGQTAFGSSVAVADSGDISRAILAVGHQDVDPSGLRAPPGLVLLGASGDHLIVHSGDAPPAVGQELRFGLDYSALVRAMTSPYVLKVITDENVDQPGGAGNEAPRPEDNACVA